ncbi:hypothetical protein ACW5W4_16065 [Aeromonas crassostreae]
MLLVRIDGDAGVGRDGRLDAEVGVIALIARPGIRGSRCGEAVLLVRVGGDGRLDAEVGVIALIARPRIR